MADEAYSSVMNDLAGYIPREKMFLILDQAKNDRDFMLVLLLYRTGRRISELLLLKPMDINWDEGLVKFKILKKRNKNYFRLKPVDDETLTYLDWYITEKRIHSEDFVFPSPYKSGKHLSSRQSWNIFNGMAKRAGIHYIGVKQPHPHHARHSFSIDFLKKAKTPVALKILKDLLDHSSIKVTETYLQFSQEDRRELLNKIVQNKE